MEKEYVEQGPVRDRRTCRIKAVLFDLDDTLLDWSQLAGSWSEFMRPLADNVHAYLTGAGHKLCDRTTFFGHLQRRINEVWDRAKEDFSGPSFREALAQACQDAGAVLSDEELEGAMQAWNWQPMPGITVFTDTLEVLDTLRARGYKIGLITNSFLPMWMRDVELNHYRLLDYFDARTTSADAGYMKPHPEIYRQMLDQLGIPACQAVFVGDRPRNDIAGANEAGLISVLMNPPHLDRPREGIEADFEIESLSELLPILDRLEEEGKDE